MSAAVASQWPQRRRRVFQSVFHTDDSQPTPHSTPCIRFPDQGQPFGGPAAPIRHQHARRAHAHAPLDAADPSPALSPTLTSSLSTIDARSQLAQPLFPSLATAADDQVVFDRAWHVVTARIALPASATADDSFGTLPPDSQLPHQAYTSDVDFYDALALIVQAPALLPRATHTEDVVAWHAQQARSHFAQHVVPLLSGCLDDQGDEPGAENRGRYRGTGRRGDYYERHMVIVMSSIRTLEAALRLYFYGFGMLVRGFHKLAVANGPGKPLVVDPELIATRFRRDIHALVGNSASPELMRSVSIVLVRLTGTILGIPSGDDSNDIGSVRSSQRLAPPTDDDLNAIATRQRLHELVEQLHNVGLAGERFQILFAEIMDSMMSDFVTGAYAGVWSASDTQSFSAATAMNTISRTAGASFTSPCILSLGDWVENHFSRLSLEVLSRVSPGAASPVKLSDVKTYQSLALGRLAALRISELFDIVLAWPSSRGALDDLRATITTTARRLQLTASFSHTLQTRLLHPGYSTLKILRTYIAIIRTLHALDHSKVLLGHVESSLQLYLCQREDAVRIVVTGLLASAEELRVARKYNETAKKPMERRSQAGHTGTGNRGGPEPGPFVTPAVGGGYRETPGTRKRRDSTPEAGPGDAEKAARDLSSTKLIELSLILNDPLQSRRASPEDEDLDWNDMTWVPDPVDASANYKRPKSEDVIGTLISALGSEDVFIKEFASVLADRLLTDPANFDQELRVLDLLKRRFGEPALQNCDVMIKDVRDSRKVDTLIRRKRKDRHEGKSPATPGTMDQALSAQGAKEMEYHARILSRLFWPNLDREHFLLPTPIVEEQKRYESGYQGLKSGRKLTWLNQLGQARVELELRDRSVTVDCTTVEATVIYAFQDPDAEDGNSSVRRSVDELYAQLQMDEDMIAAALTFWVAKGILRHVQHDVYAVAETLAAAANADSSSAANAGSSGSAAGQQPGAAMSTAEDKEDGGEPPRKTAGGKPAGASAKEQERRAMYWQYICGMLTNASATMPLGQMAMMMKMLISDGFPWSNEELQEFLGEKIADGELEVVGGKYRLPRK
ncbi:hypothetical protein B0T26DRAFT_645786 [Lasiosphaeria miniovina]|uniref:Anaphase-promoting complex subunit 2 n=1 Tax=Lasiosphaeria miniovina TaxID=1954250 RepID=A0AA40AJJ1_9PEZI|nr:uncharacterized protein B0T26DRAFT_645786 [Lasiosphaeria miniovina]KAK0717024.1 hypothetical protein B0T26DRAFT_645786 [Lasiosphaeria miniovina]